MDNRFRFPFSTRQRIDNPPPQPLDPPTDGTHTPISGGGRNWLSMVFKNPLLPMLALVAVAFLLGNQVGCEFQKRKGINKQIKEIEKQHQATLKLMDSLFVASAKKEEAALQQVSTFYETLQKLDLKSAVVKEQLAKSKQSIEVQNQDIKNAVIENNKKVDERVKDSEKRVNYFGIPDDGE